MAMQPEPLILETIRKARRRALLHEAGLLAMLAAGLVSVLILFIIPFAAGKTGWSPMVTRTGMSRLILASVVIAAVVGAAGIPLYVLALRRDSAFFANLTRRAGGYDLGELARFMNALDGVASRAGFAAPRVTVLDDAAANALAFEAGEAPSIGVTRGALEAGLEYRLIEAVMAHELAGVAAGDFLRRPRPSSFEGAALFMLWLLAMLGVVAVPIARRGHAALVAFSVALALAAWLVLASLWLKRIRKILGHDYILADSIAVKMTGNAGAMLGAIEQMDRLVNSRGGAPFPETALGLKYLFAPPRSFSEDAAAYLKRRGGELGYDLRESVAKRRAEILQGEMDELAEWSRRLLSDRIENISRIEEDGRPPLAEGGE